MTALMPDQQLDDSLPIMAPPGPVRLPRVNLLPPEIIERRALVRLGQRLSGVVLIAALVGGVVGYEAGGGRAEAQQRLDAAQRASAQLRTERARLAGAQTALAAAQQAQQTLQAAMKQEILWSRYDEEIKLKLPKNVRLSNVTFTSAATSTAAGAPAGSANAKAAAAAQAGATSAAPATGTLTGSAENQYAVADLLQNLSLVPGFANVYLTSTSPLSSAAATSASTAGSGPVSFTVTVDLTTDAVSHRYDDITGG